MKWYGQLPHRRIRGLVGYVDGEMVAMSGLCFYETHVEAFCELKEPAYRHKKTLVKAGWRLVEMMKEFGGPVVAAADDNEKNAGGFLMHLGFEYAETFDGMEMYTWHG